MSTTQMLSKVFHEIIEQRGFSFQMRDKELTTSEVSDDTGFLPLLIEIGMVRAQEVFGDQWNHQMSYNYVPNALCQMVPDEASLKAMPLSMILLFADHAMEQLSYEHYWKQNPKAKRRPDELPPPDAKWTIPLDAWMDVFVSRYEARQIKLNVPSTSAPNNPGRNSANPSSV